MTRLAIALAVLAATPMSVDVRSADGFVLKGRYFSPRKVGPAIVLYHQCDSDRHVWDRLATDLAHAGFHVLTFDSRGYGESKGGGRPTKEKFSSDVVIFAASAQRDPGAGNAVEVARTSQNPRSVAKECADAAHGVRLFTAHSELEPAIVDWLRSVTEK